MLDMLCILQSRYCITIYPANEYLMQYIYYNLLDKSRSSIWNFYY